MNDKMLKIPTSWKEIKLSNYEKWYMMQPSSHQETVALVSFVLDIEVEEVLSMPISMFNDVVNVLSFIEHFPDKVDNQIMIGDELYSITPTDKMTTAEYVDIDSLFANDESEKLSKALAILCRKRDEKYDSDLIEERQKIFADLTMDSVYPLIAFFLSKGEIYQRSFSTYSQVKQEAQRCVKDIDSLVKNTDGTKRLPIWRRIKYIALKMYLKLLLKKYCSIKSIA